MTANTNSFVRRSSLLMALLLGPWAAGACSEDSTEPQEPLATVEETTFAPELGVDLTTMNRLPQGIYWADIGEVPPQDSLSALPFDLMFVHYDGWLSDGFQWADSLPVRFILGTGEVISGWDLGLVGIRSGGSRRLVVPPANAYQRFTDAPVPPNSVLVTDVKVDSIVRLQE